MSMNPFSLLEKAINEHGSSTILKERLALVGERLAKIEEENSDLKRKLELANAEMERLKALVPSSEFQLYRGVKLRRKPSSGFERSVYCPQCEVGMATDDRDDPFVCGRCRALSPFNSGELNTILRKLRMSMGIPAVHERFRVSGRHLANDREPDLGLADPPR